MSRPDTDDWRAALGALLPDGAAAADDTPAPAPATVSAGQLRVSVERKGRGGKTATIIYGFAEGYPEADIDALAATLKRRLGTGGSARGGEILIQGDRATAVADVLRSLGHKVRIC